MEWIQKIDFAVLDWIQQHIKGDFLDFLMPLITALGNGGIFFGLLAVFLLCRKKYRRAGIALLGGLTFCLIFGNLLLKPLVARIRPYDLMEGIELLIKPLKDYSFPSGHTMASFACASVFWHYRDTFKKMVDRCFGFGFLRRIFQIVPVCSLSNGCSLWRTVRLAIWLDCLSDC